MTIPMTDLITIIMMTALITIILMTILRTTLMTELMTVLITIILISTLMADDSDNHNFDDSPYTTELVLMTTSLITKILMTIILTTILMIIMMTKILMTSLITLLMTNLTRQSKQCKTLGLKLPTFNFKFIINLLLIINFNLKFILKFKEDPLGILGN